MWLTARRMACVALVGALAASGCDDKPSSPAGPTARPAAAHAPVAPPPTDPPSATSSVSATSPAAPKQTSRAEALAGISQLETVVRKRLAKLRESDDACEARKNADEDRVRQAIELIGSRIPSTPSDRFQYLIWTCQACLALDDHDPDTPECREALAYLQRLDSAVRASK